MDSLVKQSLQNAIRKHLVKIEDLIKAHGLDLPEATYIARDPERPDRIIVLSTEAAGKLGEIFEQARNAK